MHIFIVILCVICVTSLEFLALSKGIDGKALSLVVGFFCGVVGYYINKKREAINEVKKGHKISRQKRKPYNTQR